MHFLAPSLLLGLLAAALPWLIHRIGRRRANPVRFAAMELLLRAERQISARRRLREILLLLMRTGIAAALPLLFAKPYTEIRSDLPATTALPQAAVILLDDSASMRRTRDNDGTPLFDRARQRARGLLDNLAPESDVALVMASEGTATPVPEPTVDRARVLAALDATACSARRADFTGAMRKAVQVLTAAQRRERIIYLITDLQAVGWEGVTGLPEGERGAPGVVILDVNQGVAWPNRAVVDLTAEPAPEAGPLGVAVVAEIANFGPAPVNNVGITLRFDGAPVAKGFVDLPASGRARKRFLHAIGAGASVREAEVEIDHDRFPLDDRRFARVEVSRGLRILVVDGDPRTVRTEDETFFLEAALRSGGSSFAVSTALPDELGGRMLAEFGSIFMANVARPSADLAAALVRYVETGGGLFISVGDKVDADVWNQRLGRLLPQPLGLPRTASARPGAAADGETVDLRPAERLAPLDRRQPLLAGFPSRGDGLSSARFFQFMLLAPAADAPNRSVVLRYENGAPALVEAEVGRGRVLLLTTTVDREWTDLPIRPGFLPLMQEAARRLAGAPSGEAVAALTIGQRREISIGADDRRIEVIKPSGQSRWLVPEARPGDRKPVRSLLFTETDEPGWYRVRGALTDGSQVDRPDDSFVVNVDTRESDPAVLPAAQRPDRARVAAGPDGAPKRRLELWHVLGATVLVLVVIESALTIRFRRGRFV
ncbi:MAG TPA: VWA domain-containing protein [Polyangia bacterium]|nr:VWA domain-containing protein [Polyangia bacterium]